MPLSEFLRMARRKLDLDQQKPSQTGFSNRGEDELVELVWENGQIMMQGQSSRPARNPTLHNSPKFRDALTSSRTEKLGDVESMLNDLSPVVPSGDLDLSQDDEMVPWLNYQVEDSLPHYCNEFLPEISGVTGNGMSTQNSFVLSDKKSSCDQNKDRLACSWPPQLGQVSDPSLGSGVSDIVSNNTSKGMVNNSTGTKETQNNMGTAGNSSNFLNFSHFSRPGTLVKSNLPISDGLPASVKGNSVKSRFVDQLNTTPKGFDFHGPSSSKTSPAERTENLCRENSIKNDEPLLVGNSNGDAAKGADDGERSVEPMVASSVGSGNSGDRISCEQTHNSKRKFRDIEESEGHGDDIETTSAGLKKPASGRGGGGSKRGRAAEVHNLSERRRRDRINEKMRALQELIPNCNKADKASMLDEAIEYLKTLQLQVQMMSMGAGLCMPPMMFPPGIHPAHLPHFSHMGVGMGMGMGMGYGMGMTDMNAGSSAYPMYPVPPMQGTHFPSPMSGPINFQRIPAPMYGHHPSQGIPTSVPVAPLVSSTVRPPITSAINSSALQTRTRGEASSSMNSNLLQPTNEVTDKSAAIRENKQATDVIGTTALTPTKSIDISKVDGGD